MRKILITGGGGYIGSVTAYQFLQNDYEVIVIDNFSTGFKSPLKVLQEKFGQERLRFYNHDIHDDLSEVFAKEPNIAAVVHFAAFSIVNESMKDPKKYYKNNVEGSKALLASLIKANIRNVVFSSTAAAYGEAQYIPIDEKHPTTPTSVYGETKVIIEQEVQQIGLHYVIFRYFNVCGASDDGLIGYSITPSSHLMQNAVRGALGIIPFKLTCPKVDTKDGTPIRDYINVVDLADAHIKAVEYLLNGGSNEIINLGTESGNSVFEIVDMVQKVTGCKFELEESEPREGETAVLIASKEKAEKILGWVPRHSLEDSVKSLVAWYSVHPNGWET